MKQFKRKTIVFKFLFLISVLVPFGANAVTVINMDLVVQGSECLGVDCPTSPAFGFDTLRLQENNLRIKFDDTSNTASFPFNDWELTINDRTNGGISRFSILDVTAGVIPFTIEAGARSNSLYVDDNGRLGLGTASPVVELHMRDGNTPTMRLEQDGSAGFTAQTWDVAGNEAVFFVRDVTNGSRLPFKIKPNSPTDSLTIGGSRGDVGVGTLSPEKALHVRRTNGTASVLVEEADPAAGNRDLLELKNSGNPRMVFRDTVANAFWRTSVESSANQFVITRSGTGASEFLLDNFGNLTLRGTLTISGGCTGCDAVFDPSYNLKSIEEHAESMFENRHLPAVGPTPDLPQRATIDVFQKTAGILNELETAHIYITQLNEQVKQKDSEISELSRRLEKIEQVLDIQ